MISAYWPKRLKILVLLAPLSVVAQTAQPATLYHSGEIYTVNPKQPWAEAMLVEQGEIKALGASTALLNRYPSAEPVDLDGHFVMPGIHDVHAHPLEAKSEFAGTCLLDASISDAEDYIDELKACAPYQQATDWVLGFGHSVYSLLDAERWPREILDQAIPDRPALIMEQTSHSVWANSLALAAAGIDRNSENPSGGVIVKDPDTGEPTGLLFDAAGDLLYNEVWLPTKAIKALNYQALLAGTAELNANGITSVVEGRSYWLRDFQAAWQQALAENRLTVRAVLSLWAYPSMNDSQQLAKLKQLYLVADSPLLRANQIKVYIDGITSNTTAAMLKPYRSVVANIPSRNGLNYFTPKRLGRYIKALSPLGFDFHIHAIGDRGVREALDAIEANPVKGSRQRLTHLEFVDPVDLPRFKQLNVSADMQVAGNFTQPHNWAHMQAYVGERSKRTVPLRELYEAQARITLSSDWDVSELNPFHGMHNALTRQPQALPNINAAIRAYTINAAYVMRQERLVGSLEAGKRADFIVLSDNIVASPQRLPAVDVLETYLDGQRVYAR